MTQLSGACWAVTDDTGDGQSGSFGDAAWVDAVEASINALVHSTTNPTRSPLQTTDEVVEARGNFDSLAERLASVVDPDGVPVFVAPVGLTQTFRGIHLRTSPGASTAAHQVELIRAREIIYNDGHSDESNFADLAATVLPLTADITVSGAGGLDTGAEEVSTWYEIYVIRNPTTGVRNLLLHKAPYFFFDESQTTEDGGHVLRRATAPVNTKLAQGFQTTNAGPVEIVDLRLLRTGAVTGNIWLTIEADVAGAPSGVALATSQVIAVNSIHTASQMIRFVFHRPASVAAATQYYVVLQGDYAASDAVHVTWRADTTAATYANGTKQFYDGAAWASDADDDFWFRLYVTRGSTALTMPTDYTQYCRIGFVYNDGTSTFTPFLALDNKVTPLVDQSIVSGVTSTFPLLTLLTGFVPPVPVALGVVVQSAVDNEELIISPVPDGFRPSTNPRENGASVFQNPVGDNNIMIELAAILTQHEGCYLSSTGGGAFDAWVGSWEWF